MSLDDAFGEVMGGHGEIIVDHDGKIIETMLSGKGISDMNKMFVTPNGQAFMKKNVEAMWIERENFVFMRESGNTWCIAEFPDNQNAKSYIAYFASSMIKDEE